MMDEAATDGTEAVRAAALTYCEAVCKARADVFETLCHDAFHMVLADTQQVWDKPAYLARVAAREAADGEPKHEIMALEVDGNMARVKLRVAIPGALFEDYLGFMQVDGDWKLINKLFRDVTSLDENG